MTTAALLAALKTVDGSGSGLDADFLDGNDADTFAIKFYTPADGNETVDNYPDGLTLNSITNDDPGWPLTAGLCMTAKNSLYRCCQLFFSSNGVLEYTRGYRADTGFTSWYRVWTENSQGSGSGMNADYVDGIHASQFIRSDMDDIVSGNTRWNDNFQVRIGSSNDFKIYHSGTNTLLDNSTGELSIR